MATAAKPNQKSSWFEGIKGWVLGLTSVLVVLPALINAAGDIYSAVAKLPRTEAERINEKLNGIYFGKDPVLRMPVPIKDGDATVDVRFEIYDKGDIRVEFGNRSQWFPFPARQSSSRVASSFSLISSAIAQTPVPKGMGSFRQVEQVQSDMVVRERTYENGVVEKVSIDPRSGEISGYSARQAEKPAAGTIPAVQQIKVAPVDLDKLRPVAAAGAAAEPQWHRSLKADLAWCRQKDNFLSRGLCEYRERARSCEPGDHWGEVPECPR
jgi:hypothetical protein